MKDNYFKLGGANRILLGIYLIWISCTIILFFIGTPSGKYWIPLEPGWEFRSENAPKVMLDVKQLYFPFDIPKYVIPEHYAGKGIYANSQQYILNRLKAYDYTEFIVYLTVPILLFFAYTLIKPINK
jgi:hypothetical protein